MHVDVYIGQQEFQRDNAGVLVEWPELSPGGKPLLPAQVAEKVDRIIVPMPSIDRQQSSPALKWLFCDCGVGSLRATSCMSSFTTPMESECFGSRSMNSEKSISGPPICFMRLIRRLSQSGGLKE